MDRFRRFDEAYYHRFYENPETRVVSPEEHDALARFIFAFAEWNHLEQKSMLDIGAGIGLWKRWLEKNRKGVEYTGTEVSQAMCKKYGFLHRDIARWRDRKKHDLVVCQGGAAVPARSRCCAGDRQHRGHVQGARLPRDHYAR